MMPDENEFLPKDLEVANSDNEICGLNSLVLGAELLVILFIPFCFGENVKNSMESLVCEVNDRMDEFSENDIRIICISRYYYHYIL